MSWADVGGVGGPLVALAAIGYAAFKDKRSADKDDKRQQEADAQALLLQQQASDSQERLVKQANEFQRELLELEKDKAREKDYYVRSRDLAEEVNAITVELVDMLEEYVRTRRDFTEHRLSLMERLEYVRLRSNMYLPRGTPYAMQLFLKLAEAIADDVYRDTEDAGEANAIQMLKNQMAMLTVMAEGVAKFGPEIEP